MPTFLQVYQLLHVYKLIRPPKFENCQITESEDELCLTVEGIENVFALAETREQRQLACWKNYWSDFQ